MAIKKEGSIYSMKATRQSYGEELALLGEKNKTRQYR